MYYYIHHTMGIILNRVDTSMISVNLKHSFSQSFNKIWEVDMDVSVKVQRISDRTSRAKRTMEDTTTDCGLG